MSQIYFELSAVLALLVQFFVASPIRTAPDRARCIFVYVARGVVDALVLYEVVCDANDKQDYVFSERHVAILLSEELSTFCRMLV